MAVDNVKTGARVSLRWEPDQKVLKPLGHDPAHIGVAVNILWDRDIDVDTSINPSHVWKTDSVFIQMNTLEELPSGLAVGYEVYLNGALLHVVSGATPHSFQFELMPEDLKLGENVLVLDLPSEEPRLFYIHKEDRNTLVVSRDFQSKGVEWGLEGVTAEGGTLALRESATKGVAKTNTAKIVTLGRKTISGVAVVGSIDVTEEVLVGEPMREIGENLYEAEIPQGKRLLVEVVE